MNNERVTLSMGAGGKLSEQLIEDVFLSLYGNDILNNLEDAADLHIDGTHIAYTTDSYTVKPLFFPGGNIGTLAICGTVNDLAVKGAKPVALSAGFIIEEGFLIEDLKTIARDMCTTMSTLGIRIVTGDTKVVSKGEVDGLFINTSGIGTIIPHMNISSRNARTGDDIIVTGTIADHGIAILNVREKLGFVPVVQSDVAPLFNIVERIAHFGNAIHVMRDPTRGGVASVLNEIAKASQVMITLYETAIAVKDEVRSCCDLLGMDPLYIANEGKIVIFVDSKITQKVLECIKQVPAGKNAVVIGKVEEHLSADTPCPVCLKTSIGIKRFVPMLEGDPLPRIC
ncbi:MAG: hydrogenase expression/formation protein HypE [Candidatus Omnitrophica bacterium]|nr:hydrogenase expression/formation protein HypE [Candidatus Omnitrophota bacterium]